MNERAKLLMERTPKIKKFCSFNGCKNNNTSDVHFHRFPQHKARCDVWVKASQNEKLKGQSASKLHTCAVVCSDHFQDWCFMNKYSKKRLVHNAIPLAPKPVPPLTFFFEPDKESTGDAGKKFLEVLFTTPLPSQTLTIKTPNKTPQKMKEELVDRGEEPPPEDPLGSPVVVNTTTISEDSNSAVNTTTISEDPNPVGNIPRRRPAVKKPRLTIYPIISKVVPQSNEVQKEEDEELDLYLKLLARKLKSYKGLERRQIMHEIDGVFLKQPGPSSTTSAPQFLMTSFENSASSPLSNAS